MERWGGPVHFNNLRGGESCNYRGGEQKSLWLVTQAWRQGRGSAPYACRKEGRGTHNVASNKRDREG
eukprot:1161145-Pelagomonas_calceolata.AAC.2